MLLGIIPYVQWCQTSSCQLWLSLLLISTVYAQVALLTGLSTVFCSLNAAHKFCQVGLMFATHHTSGTPE